jgi:hypothetical protein
MVLLPPGIRELKLSGSFLLLLIQFIFASTELLDLTEFRSREVIKGINHLIHVLAKVLQNLIVFIVESKFLTDLS